MFTSYVLVIVFLAGVLSGLLSGIAGNQGCLRAAGLSTFGSGRAFLATSTAVALSAARWCCSACHARTGAVITDKAQLLLKRFDEHSEHCDAKWIA